MNEVALQIFSNVGALALGFIIGQSVHWRKVRKGVYVPGAVVTIKHAKLVGALLIIIAFITMVQDVIYQQEQTNCNNAFREALKNRSQATSKINEANAHLVQELIELPDNDFEARDKAREQYIQAVQEYTITRENNPYPDPKC